MTARLPTILTATDAQIAWERHRSGGDPRSGLTELQKQLRRDELAAFDAGPEVSLVLEVVDVKPCLTVEGHRIDHNNWYSPFYAAPDTTFVVTGRMVESRPGCLGFGYTEHQTRVAVWFSDEQDAGVLAALRKGEVLRVSGFLRIGPAEHLEDDTSASSPIILSRARLSQDT